MLTNVFFTGHFPMNEEYVLGWKSNVFSQQVHGGMADCNDLTDISQPTIKKWWLWFAGTGLVTMVKNNVGLCDCPDGNSIALKQLPWISVSTASNKNNQIRDLLKILPLF